MKEKRESRMGMSRYEEENGKERMGLGEKEGRGDGSGGGGGGGSHMRAHLAIFIDDLDSFHFYVARGTAINHATHASARLLGQILFFFSLIDTDSVVINSIY